MEVNSMLVVSRYFIPGHKGGGPIKSISNLVRLLSNNINFDIFTCSKDFGDKFHYNGIEVNRWNENVVKGSVFYSSGITHYFKAFQIIRNTSHDSIYINSFFDFKYSIFFILCLKLFRKTRKCNVILAPRGELTVGAMSLKAGKKKAFLSCAKILKLHAGVKFHFTSQQESEDAKKFLGEIDHFVSPNMHSEPPKFIEKEKQVGVVNLIFVSRISPKKNLLTVFKALEKIKTCRVNFTVIGPDEDKEYWECCLLLAKNFSDNISLEYFGSLKSEDVNKHLNRSHLFCLPTLNENYGHAIVEAMVCSNIVAISNQTPWCEVDNHGGNVCESHDVNSLKEFVVKVANMSELEFNRASFSVYSYITDVLSKNEDDIKNKFLNI